VETRYLLSCSCKLKIPVKPSQAGQTVKCDCGNELEVPAMQEVKKLERIVIKPKSQTIAMGKNWDSRRACILLGGVITIAAILMFAYFQWTRPRLRPIEQYPPLTTWSMWQSFRQGAVRRPLPAEKQFLDNLINNQRWTNVTLVVAGIGVLVMLSSFVMRGSKTTRPIRRPPSRIPARP